MTPDRIADALKLDRLGRNLKPFAHADGPPPDRLVPFLAWSTRGAWGMLGLAALFSSLVGTFDVMAAILLGTVIDRALETGVEALWQANSLFLIGVTAFLLLLRPLGFGLSAAMQSIVVQPNVNTMVLTRLHRWTMGQDITFFDNDFAGRIAQKQMQTARAISDIMVETINSVVFGLASLIATTILLISIDWRLSAITLVWLVGYIAFIAWFMPRIRMRSKARAAARAAVTGQVVDTVTNMRTVKLFASAGHEDAAALDSMGRYMDRAREFGTLSTVFRSLLMVLAGTLPVILVGAVLWLWTRGVATPGDIAAAGTVSLRLSQMTGWISFTLMGIYANIGEAEDGIRTLTPAHKLTDPENPGRAPYRGDLVFDDISFAYGRQKGGVEGIQLRIREGEKVGIVGASGAGKSTLVSLLLRLYDVEGGRITLGGQDLRWMKQDDLRARIGMVTQDTAMFNRTARENIVYGRPDATEEEMIAATKRAEAHEFILGLQDHQGNTGYDAYLGERSVKLSGGQRQRIALARAIVKDAPVLVLDEATSALDSEVEASIQSALEQVMEGKTVLAIAHRLSTIARMDRIVVMDAGRIAEEGTHHELLARDGLYARYWQRQSGGFLSLEAAE